MSYPLVICPATAHIERLEVDDHPLGAIVIRCSGFRPACAVTCGAPCGALIDGRFGAASAVDVEASPTCIDACGPIAYWHDDHVAVDDEVVFARDDDTKR